MDKVVGSESYHSISCVHHLLSDLCTKALEENFTSIPRCRILLTLNEVNLIKYICTATGNTANMMYYSKEKCTIQIIAYLILFKQRVIVRFIVEGHPGWDTHACLKDPVIYHRQKTCTKA